MMMYPHLNPIAFSVGPLTVHWYGLMYALSFFLGWIFLSQRSKMLAGAKPNVPTKALEDLLFFMTLGVVFGGRIGYVLFYHTAFLWQDPLFLLRLWEPGMSFHGGLLGVLLALAIFAKRYHMPFLAVSDFVAPAIPIGLGLGRIGNFINGELWGRPTDVPWGMIFPYVDNKARHPTQLYEAGLEGLALFIILWRLSAKPQKIGKISAVFLISYAIIRFGIEFYRQPDGHLGVLNHLTMGQWLCIPMFLAGVFLYAHLPSTHEQNPDSRSR